MSSDACCCLICNFSPVKLFYYAMLICFMILVNNIQYNIFAYVPTPKKRFSSLAVLIARDRNRFCHFCYVFFFLFHSRNQCDAFDVPRDTIMNVRALTKQVHSASYQTNLLFQVTPDILYQAEISILESFWHTIITSESCLSSI